MTAIRTLRAAVLALAAATAVPAAADGQVPTLAAVDSLVLAGQYDAARGILGRWWSARESFDVPASDMARALLLRARLATAPARAEADYLAVVLGYPASDLAPDALLRLGQGLLATGDAARAVAYLDRLVADYPGRPERLTGLLWLARANTAARRPAAACAAARSGLEDARDPDLAAMLRVETGIACSAVTARAGSASSSAATPSASDAPSATDAPGARDASAGDWAVQSGAFRHRAGADALMERLRRAGFSPRLVRVPANDLLRVRVGRYTTSGEAAALVTRLRDQGFDAVVVRNAGQERQP